LKRRERERAIGARRPNRFIIIRSANFVTQIKSSLV